MIKKGIFVSLILALVLLVSCNKPKPPDFKGVENMNFSIKGFTTVNITGDVIFFNPNKKNILLKEINVQVLLDEKNISHFSKELNMDVLKLSDFSVPLNMEVSLKEFTLKEFLTIFKNGQSEAKLHFKGYAKVKMYGMPFKIPIDYYEDVDKMM